ncbi:MAG: hypothetical protein K2N74_02030 [Clostridiales bacterium]|nr:hypothetical protein [Clostridiales bacterium]
MKTRDWEKEDKGSSTPLYLHALNLIVFCLLVTVLIVLVVNNHNARYLGGFPAWYVLLPVAIVLTAENGIKLWALKSYGGKIACYVFDVALLMTLTVFTDGVLISTLYIIILSEFYLTQKKLMNSIAMGATSIVLFLITFAVSGAARGSDVTVASLIASAINDLILLVLHFLIINFTVQIASKNKELRGAFEELNKSNEKLRVAYAELQEVTALEERQRIAKDIHDTAGHSITTVIMQTEAAKLVVETDPEEAKLRIAAANLQAKHALEELRESVHLLSGTAGGLTLKGQLESIIHDTTDGTGIAVRSDIDELELCDAKSRFICNTLKEGISNGLRHGGATAFWFELKQEGKTVRFLLSDNGSGQDIASLKEGFGLSGMHTRAESLGGDVWFETEEGEGFEIHLTLPTDNAKGDGSEN